MKYLDFKNSKIIKIDNLNNNYLINVVDLDWRISKIISEFQNYVSRYINYQDTLNFFESNANNLMTMLSIYFSDVKYLIYTNSTEPINYPLNMGDWRYENVFYDKQILLEKIGHLMDDDYVQKSVERYGAYGHIVVDFSSKEMQDFFMSYHYQRLKDELIKVLMLLFFDCDIYNSTKSNNYNPYNEVKNIYDVVSCINYPDYLNSEYIRNAVGRAYTKTLEIIRNTINNYNQSKIEGWVT